MHRYVLCFFIPLVAFSILPMDVAAGHKVSLPFEVSHVERDTFSIYVGPGVTKGAEGVTQKALGKKFLATPDEGQCTQKYGCLNCSWARVCAPTSDDTLVEVSRSACPNNRPFCDPKTGTCVVDTSLKCVKPSTITCFKKEGYFPHPTDCKKFIYCSNYTSFLFECLGTNSYNVDSQKCNSPNCFNIICASNEGTKVLHPLSNVFFAYCSGVTAVGFDRCLGDDILNVTSQMCEPNCVNEGLISDTLNCTKYYKCSYELVNGSRRMVRKHQQCEANYSFNSEEFQCVPGVAQTDCIQSY